MSEEEAKLAEFLRTEQERLDRARQERMAEKGQLPFAQFDTGDSKIRLVRKVPQSPEANKYGRAGFYVVQAKQERMWTVNPRSPIYRQIIEYLTKGQLDIIVTKTGSGKNTRYDVRPGK